MKLRLIGLAASLLPMFAQADTIWKCEDLKKVPQFSSIQCAADATVYVPSNVNTGSAVGTKGDANRRYLDFITQHNARMQQEEQKKKKRSSEGRNLNRFKSYSVPAR